MRSVCGCILAGVLVGAAPARADEELARQRFEQGFLAGTEGRWEEAVNELEASLAEREKPATRYNLVLAYHELGRALDVIRHATTFLREHVEVERADARAHVQELISAASRQVAVLDISSLPPGTQVTIDGTAPSVASGALVYVTPGQHVLVATVAPKVHEAVEVTLGAGHLSEWPRSLPNASLQQIVSTPPLPILRPELPRRDAPSTPPPPARWNERAAWALGVGGAALFVAGVACLWVAEERSTDLSQRGLAGATRPGYLTSVERYRDAGRAVAPLALSASVAMSAAAALIDRLPHRGALAWSIASTVLGASLLGVGGYLLVQEPAPVIPTSSLDQPSRLWGASVVALGFPFVSYGISSMLRARRDGSLSSRSQGLTSTW